ncbi:short-chain dehydrogenase/reductase SDR [Novosphingobium sp. Rr 2-17]|uniref:SDR family NAD(P)-dependent oxidoreductase n=1 Tax=Novosphingobium sp. Rr 2-17 TaxID=555793 RepID=UPI000269989E|nr:SDR family NAD(P)-dependent oxidoreductase [Novosphingobium sp. Rr 2-17]EIZ78781.1 short-chain dehydrogenase/reductase SDR [Novosphingobium sp. Rr 2-17]
MPLSKNTILIVGASRGLGHALASEFLTRGWTVIGTVRGDGRTQLHDLADSSAGRLAIEVLDINDAGQIAGLRQRLSGRVLDAVFVNSGTTTSDPLACVGDVPVREFVDVMVTNALSPMLVIEALQDLVSADGLIGAMSSGQGSIANNTTGSREVYRASKAALNQLMRSFAAREEQRSRAFVLMAPGWIRTGLGGPDAPFGMEEAVPAIVDVLLAKRERSGLEYLDRFGAQVPW